MKISRYLLLAFFFLGSVACGDGASSAPKDGGTTSDADTTQPDAGDEPATCNFTNCDGCCDGNVCNNSASDDSCGLDGRTCQTCENGDECFSGSCATPTATCDSLSCGGCCDGNQCLEGNVGSACGTQGGACLACADGDVCNEDGVCEPVACDASSCPDGCCSANGECVVPALQDVNACGDGGEACNSCSNDAIDCVGGTCIEDQPCLDFCVDGCCTPQGQCLRYTDQDPDSCGQEGTCTSCTGDDSCITGVCSEDPAWVITIDSAIVSDKDENGSDWDTFGGEGLPDPFVTGALTNDVVVDWATDTVPDTITPNWDEEVDAYAQSDLIAEGLEFNVLDADFASFETIGNCIMTITLDDLMAGTKTISCGPLVEALTIDFAPQ